MSEEEKEAVDTLAIRASTSKAGYEDYPNCVCMKKHLIVVLNLMQKQQKEIEKNKEDIQRMQELLDLSNANNVKKDNIINEMAIFISNIDEDICKHQTGQFCEKGICEVPLKNCIKCIKQYFERKVNL